MLLIASFDIFFFLGRTITPPSRESAIMTPVQHPFLYKILEILRTPCRGVGVWSGVVG